MAVISWNVIEGGQKGQIVAQSVQTLLTGFFALGIKNIQNECNKVSLQYKTMWSTRAPTDSMNEYNLRITYENGRMELDPEYQLFEPSTVHCRILDCYHERNSAIPAMIEHSISDPLNPTLTIFLKTLDVRSSSKIFLKGFTNSFKTVINHELLHACGDSPILRREIHDGVLRHTLVCNEAISNIISQKP